MILKWCFLIALQCIASSNSQNVAYYMDNYFESKSSSNNDSSDPFYWRSSSELELLVDEILEFLNETCGHDEDFQAFQRLKNHFEECTRDLYHEIQLVGKGDPHYYKKMCYQLTHEYNRCIGNFVDTYSRCLSQQDAAEIHLARDILQSTVSAICLKEGQPLNLIYSLYFRPTYDGMETNLLTSDLPKATENYTLCNYYKRTCLIGNCFELHDQNIEQLDFEEQCTKLSSLHQCIVKKLRNPAPNFPLCQLNIANDCGPDELYYAGQPELADWIESGIELVQQAAPCKLDTRSAKLNAASAAYHWKFARKILGSEIYYTPYWEFKKTRDLVLIFNEMINSIVLTLR